MPFIQGSKVITSGGQIVDGVVDTADLADNAVTDDKVGAHTTSKITVPTTQLSGTVATAQIADNAVTLAKLEHGTHGDLLYYDESGVPTRLSPGTSGNVLQTNGADADPSWGNVSQTLFFPATREDGGAHSAQAEMHAVELADGTTTRIRGHGFVPSNTISSIVAIARAASSTTGNVVINHRGGEAIDGIADSTDNAGNSTHGDFASNTNWQEITVPTTAYDGLTQNRVWGFQFGRLGSDGSDTLGASLYLLGWIIRFA